MLTLLIALAVWSQPMTAEERALLASESQDRPLTADEYRTLKSYGWSGRAGQGLGVWVSVGEQRLRVIEHGRVTWEAPCSTAARGTGSRVDSFQTPLGWHSVCRKTGEGAPWGRVFRGGEATDAVWRPGDTTTEDLVLTRILFLQGEEPGKNRGGDVDSYSRHIYIHGTNDEAAIGTPASHGCIRVRNDDAIVAYGRIPVGAPVLITEAHGDAQGR